MKPQGHLILINISIRGYTAQLREWVKDQDCEKKQGACHWHHTRRIKRTHKTVKTSNDSYFMEPNLKIIYRLGFKLSNHQQQQLQETKTKCDPSISKLITLLNGKACK